MSVSSYYNRIKNCTHATTNSMSIPPPPGPIHTLRAHSSPITVLHISSPDNARIYSGDTKGLLVVTSTRSLRPITTWQAHTDSLLGVDEWRDRVVTQARDNKLCVWTRLEEAGHEARVGVGSALPPDLPKPDLLYSMDVNALNFCRFSLMEGLAPTAREEALIALPNLVDSEVADIWNLSKRDRIHAGVGQDGRRTDFWSANATEGRSGNGIIMALHLYNMPVSGPSLPSSSSTTLDAELRLLTAYESGNLMLRRYDKSKNTGNAKEKSVEGKGWETLWNVRLHKESIMGMKVSLDNSFALSISADHLIGRYDLNTSDAQEKSCSAYPGKQAGNSAIAIRDDGRVCAVAGWDGHIRLYSTKNMKPLGTLKYHKVSCQALEFAHSVSSSSVPAQEQIAEDDEDDMEKNAQEEEGRRRWLVAGGKDNRVSIWGLISFQKK